MPRVEDRLGALLRVRVREDTRMDIEHYARQWGRTVSQAVREIIEDWLRERHKKAGA